MKHRPVDHPIKLGYRYCSACKAPWPCLGSLDERIKALEEASTS